MLQLRFVAYIHGIGSSVNIKVLIYYENSVRRLYQTLKCPKIHRWTQICLGCLESETFSIC